MNIRRFLTVLAFALVPGTLPAQSPLTDDGRVRVGVVKNPYHGSRNVPELSLNPDYIHAAGLERLLERWDALLTEPIREVRLTDEEQEQYGKWNRLGMANGHLAEIVSENARRDLLTVGLEANCNSVIGVLGGLQSSGPDGSRRRVGLVFIDAHGDFNTPETTLSGMLGGMPVAVSAGHALDRLRLKSGLADPVPVDHIVWGGVRDLDPLEAERFEEYGVRQISVADIRTLSENLHRQMRHLSESTDVIYVHIDMDVLDPAEVPGHDLNVPDGPTSEELAAALAEIFAYPKAAALGIASTPAGSDDPDEVSRRAALSLIHGAVEGVKARASSVSGGGR
ncbi:MAG: hypothetical protein GWM92_16345 [Gemmatimonadetes bacterium]|nr:hypothetical protein [Gemmatimonadota bacterium]NIR80326.1 hypothetical protein [Gemmatimonadota bacterium]NIT89089.1 hypothetical protein [Gemmatimonadota bacterium]NIU32886.1 hypothetical protein [Gemmatimonadota bacterium]NIU37292.1 hypothetical protein [Gemmatimonadota bacterium]